MEKGRLFQKSSSSNNSGRELSNVCSIIINLGTCDINNNRINLRSMVSSFPPPPHPLPMMRNSTENRKNPAKIRVLFCWLGFNLFWPKLNKKGRYGKVLKISPGHIYFKGPFWGAYLRREICISKSIGLAL